MHRTTRYPLDDGGESRGECYLLTEEGTTPSSVRTNGVIFADSAVLQCEIDSPGWTIGGLYEGPPGAGGPLLFDASAHAGQDFFMLFANDPSPGLILAGTPGRAHPYVNGSPAAYGGSDPCASDPTTACLDLSDVDIMPDFLRMGPVLRFTAEGIWNDGSHVDVTEIASWAATDSLPSSNVALFGSPNNTPFKPQGVISGMKICATTAVRSSSTAPCPAPISRSSSPSRRSTRRASRTSWTPRTACR